MPEAYVRSGMCVVRFSWDASHCHAENLRRVAHFHRHFQQEADEDDLSDRRDRVRW